MYFICCSSIEKLISINDCTYAVSKDGIQIYENVNKIPQSLQKSFPEESSNCVFGILKIQEHFIIIYKYGYVEIFDENFLSTGSPVRVNFVGFRIIHHIDVGEGNSFFAVLGDNSTQIITINTNSKEMISVADVYFYPEVQNFGRINFQFEHSKTSSDSGEESD